MAVFGRFILTLASPDRPPGFHIPGKLGLNDAPFLEGRSSYNKNMWYRQRDGHTFVAEKNNGEIVFKDPQSGAIIKSAEEYIDFDRFEFLRIDNLEVTDRGISACKKN